MRSIPGVKKMTPCGWVMWAPNMPHVMANIIGVIIQGESGNYHGFAKFMGKDYRQSPTATLKGSVKKVNRALSGLS